jgi:hypothetical protein
MRWIALASAAAVGCALSLTGCSNSNPVQAAADLVSQGTTAAADANLESALHTAQADVATYRAENGADPSAAQFSALPDVTLAGRSAAFSYQLTATGFCLAASSITPPAVTRYATDSTVLPAGQTC